MEALIPRERIPQSISSGVSEPLSREAELEAAREAVRGVAGARNRIVVANLGMVFAIVREYGRWRSGSDFDDLVQEGVLGLMRALDRFDPERGVRFMSYAAWWVRSYVVKSISEMISEERPSIDEEDGEGLSILRTLASSDRRPDEVYERVELAESLCSLLDSVEFTKRERLLLYARLYTSDPRTLSEIGSELGISRERVLQVENVLKKRLRSVLLSTSEGA